MDVFEHGRLAAFLDPEGAPFAVWQPKQHVGATVVGEMNTVCWSELATRDVDKAAAFYKGLFGWSTKDSTGQPVKYVEFTPEGDAMPTGGLLQMNEQWEGMPAHWGIYFRVSDCDTAAAQVQQLGGKICHGPFDAPNVGRMAVCNDPQGAVFSIISLFAA
jgi:predicted enzyme related to lactoylglutathione lyase